MADVVLAFSADVQSLGPLKEAAYRLIGRAACLIDATPAGFECRLTPARGEDPDAIRSRFLDLVTDENLREKLAGETGRTRDLIMALAFGSLLSLPTPSEAPPP